MSAAQRADARQTLALLPEGMTLSQAVEIALAAIPSMRRCNPLPLAMAVDRFFLDCQQRGLRAATLSYYEGHLMVFARLYLSTTVVFQCQLQLFSHNVSQGIRF